MEKINNILLNYKTYKAFQKDLNDEKISPNSIAFIQDNRRIWAHGKEYACNALSVVNNGQGSINFVDELGNTVLALSADPNGYVNVSGIVSDSPDMFVSREVFSNYVNVVELLKRDFEKYKAIVTGDFDNILVKDDVIDTISKYSNSPVKGDTIFRALETKQDNLIAGKGIEIQDNVISSFSTEMVTLSKGKYDRLVENDEINPNTYYFTYEGEEGEEGDTWHFGEPFPIILSDGQNSGWTFPIPLTGDDDKEGWVFPITLKDNWAFGGTFPITLR